MTLARRSLLTSLLLVLAGCETLQSVLSSAPRPSAQVTGARFAGFSPESVRLDLDVEVSNPYSVDLPVLDIQADFAAAGQRVLGTRLQPDAPIPASGARTVRVPVDIRFAEVLAALSSLTPGQTVPYRVDLVLGFDAPAIGAVEVPVKREGDLWIPKPPSLSVRSVGLSELSLSRVRAELKLSVQSDNAVALPLRQLDYGLQLAGISVATGALSPGSELPANGTSQLVLPLDVNPLQTGRALFTALSSGQVDYALKGGLEVETPFGPWSVPVEASGRAPLSSAD